MKKKINSILAAALSCVCFLPSAMLFGCGSRDKTLKIYNWGDYIDVDLLPIFEDWYYDETGEKIKVKYDTFDTNETMLMRIETQRADYDLVCPSDYIAERMISGGLAQKLDKEIFDIDMSSAFYEGLSDMVKPFDDNNEYYVPYVWGTFGIMYDTNHITPNDKSCKSWDALWRKDWEKNGTKRVLMKDSVRDAYSAAMLYANKEKLSAASNNFTDYDCPEYKSLLTSYFSDVNENTIEQAKQALIEQKNVVYKYEIDNGKEDMLAGTTEAWLAFLWSCDALLVMNEDGGDHFYYEVPREGSNVWVDGWLIPKYAKNTKAANYFLKFINTYEYAKQNFEWMGSSMSLKSVMDEAKQELNDNDEFFENFYPEFKDMYIDALFPPKEVLSRCGVMRDCGVKKSVDLASMWIDVKTS